MICIMIRIIRRMSTSFFLKEEAVHHYEFTCDEMITIHHFAKIIQVEIGEVGHDQKVFQIIDIQLSKFLA